MLKEWEGGDGLFEECVQCVQAQDDRPLERETNRAGNVWIEDFLGGRWC